MKQQSTHLSAATLFSFISLSACTNTLPPPPLEDGGSPVSAESEREELLIEEVKSEGTLRQEITDPAKTLNCPSFSGVHTPGILARVLKSSFRGYPERIQIFQDSCSEISFSYSYSPEDPALSAQVDGVAKVTGRCEEIQMKARYFRESDGTVQSEPEKVLWAKLWFDRQDKTLVIDGTPCARQNANLDIFFQRQIMISSEKIMSFQGELRDEVRVEDSFPNELGVEETGDSYFMRDEEQLAIQAPPGFFID